MSERLPFPTDLFRTSGPRGVHDDAEVIRLMRLGDRGEYLEAAREAAELLQSRGRDVRLIAVYLAGSFVERGAAGLPELYDCMATELTSSPRDTEAQARLCDAAVKWLCRALISHIGFHTAQRSEIWQRWLTEVSAEQVAEIGSKSFALAEARPDSAGALSKIGRWSQEKLGPASARARKTIAIVEPPAMSVAAPPEPSWDGPEPEPSWDEPESEPDDDDDEDNEDDDDDYGNREFEYDDSSDEHALLDDDDPTPLKAPSFVSPPRRGEPMPSHRRGRGPEHDPGVELLISPALAQLCDKLRGFELLVERGELDKAAIVASDIQAVLERFDPLVYLPSLFGRYFQLLSRVIGEVEARWNAGDSAARRVLESFYRVDLERFVNDE